MIPLIRFGLFRTINCLLNLSCNDDDDTAAEYFVKIQSCAIDDEDGAKVCVGCINGSTFCFFGGVGHDGGERVCNSNVRSEWSSVVFDGGIGSAVASPAGIGEAASLSCIGKPVTLFGC